MTNDKDQELELLTPNELASMLKISKTSVYRLIQGRKIRFYKVMGGIRFKKDDIMTFLKEIQIDPLSKSPSNFSSPLRRHY